MSTLALSLLQQPLVWIDGEANLAHFARLLAPIDDQDLIVLPEMFTTGFAMEAAGNALPEKRVVEWLAQWARRTGAMVGSSAAIAPRLAHLPQVYYDLRFPQWSRNQQDYDLALYVANWLAARAIENQAYVAGCNRVGTDGNQHHYSGNSLIIDPQGTVMAQADPGAAACLQAPCRWRR